MSFNILPPKLLNFLSYTIFRCLSLPLLKNFIDKNVLNEIPKVISHFKYLLSFSSQILLLSTMNSIFWFFFYRFSILLQILLGWRVWNLYDGAYNLCSKTLQHLYIFMSLTFRVTHCSSNLWPRPRLFLNHFLCSSEFRFSHKVFVTFAAKLTFITHLCHCIYTESPM